MKLFSHILALYGQRAGGPAVNRNRAAQLLPIQWPTRKGIYQKAAILAALLALVLLPEAFTAVAQSPVADPANGPLIAASGNRNRTSGALNNVGTNGNWWSCAPNSRTNAHNLNFNASAVNPLNNNNRANGLTVRPSRALGRCQDMRPQVMTYTYNQIHELVTFAYLKAREEERDTPAQLEFEVDLERNLKELTVELLRRQWSPQPLDWFVNLEPTVREVFAPQFRDRVVSHVLFMMIAPIFERYFIYDSFSCRIGKGTLHGIERMEHHLRSVTDNYREDAWSLNYDITAYFMSIDRARLYKLTSATLSKHQVRFPKIIDYGFADYLIRSFLERDPLDGCVYHGNPDRIMLVRPGKSLRDQPPGVGVPIGDVINQLFSNIYLNPLDQYIRRDLKIRNSFRYVDDGRCFHRSRVYLEECRDRIGEFLEQQLYLRLHPDKTTITNIYDGVTFLGAVVKPFRRYAKNDTMGRFRSYIRQLEQALSAGAPIDPATVLPALNSRLGYLSHFNEYNAVSKALAAAPHIRASFAFARDLSKAIIIKPINK